MGESTEDFGTPLAHKDDDALQGKSSKGEQNGKENLEEGEEAPTDQAVDKFGPPQTLSPNYVVRSALTRTTRPDKNMENGKQGRYLASGPA